MRRRLIVVIALVALGALVVSAPASASSRDTRAKKKAACSLKKKAKCKKAKLKNIKVGKQNLSGANLKGATITGGTFSGTNLSNADLSNARITNVTFKNVRLSGASFSGARLSGVRFTGVQASAVRRLARDALTCSSVKYDGRYTIPFFCAGTSVDLSHMVVNDTTFAFANLPNADFSFTDFTDSGFSGGQLVDANFYATTWGSTRPWTFSGTVLTGAMFDASRGAGIDNIDTVTSDSLDGASFLDAKRYAFDPGLSADMLVHGLNGPATVLVQRAEGTSAPYSAITITGTWPKSLYSYAARCEPAKSAAATTGGCVRKMAKGDTATVVFETPGTIEVTSGGLACSSAAVTGGYRTTCTGTVSGDTVVTYAPVRETVKVISVLQNGVPTPMSKIRFESVTSAGARTLLTSCILQTSCSATVVPGTWLRVSVFREHSNGYFGMNCPGETGDAFTNNLTEWPWGDDTLSGDAGDTTRYALRRICPAFEVTDDITLTAVNDSPDGAPSG